MKKYFILLLALLVIPALSACKAASPADEAAIAHNEETVDACAVDLVAYYSLEEFESALTESQIAAQNNEQTYADEIAKLSELDAYYIPDGIPEGYVLGKILVGAVGVGFYYYPADRVESRDKRMGAESKQMCFEFIFGRWDLEEPLSGIMAQLGQGEDDYIGGRFLLESGRNTYYWEQNGDLLSLRFPRDWELPMTGLDAYCSAETVLVSP